MRKSTKLFFAVFFLICSLLSVSCGILYAAVPHLINYQGRLTDSSGVPLNGSYNLTFRIYDAETAGNLLWEETQPVVIQKGVFSMLLGGVTVLNLAFDKPYWLEVKVGAEVMSPRQRIASVGYAVRAEVAENIEGVLPVVKGGTGAATVESALNNLLPAQTGNSGKVLTTNGTTHSWGIPSGIPTNIQVFTTSGTWIKPAGVSRVYVKVWGGGGGGCGSFTFPNPPDGGGGGASSFAGDSTLTVYGGGGGSLSGVGRGGSAIGGAINIPGANGGGAAGGGGSNGSPGGFPGGGGNANGSGFNGGGGGYSEGLIYVSGNATVTVGNGGGGGNSGGSNGGNGMVVVYW